jgi:thiol-disulfide isomerase/thioredoxin
MKKLLALCIAVICFACKEDTKVDYALFSGKIDNLKGDKVSIFKGRETVKEILLNEDGTFADTLTIESGYYNLDHGNEIAYMYLSPGNNINVILDTNQFDETIEYSGNGSENNNFLAAKFIENEKSNFDFPKVFAMAEADFLSKINEVKRSKKDFLAKAKGISSDFKILEEKGIEFDYLLKLKDYPSYHAYYADKKDFKPSEDFLKPLESLDYTNEADYNSIENYKWLVLDHYDKILSKSDDPAKVFTDIKKNTFPALKNDFAASLRYDINPNNKNNEIYYNGMLSLSSDDKFKESITAKYNSVKKLAKGMPSPEFVNYENHKGGNTSLNDLKGKYVYIDVWATWCGPCIAEIPSLKNVEKQYHGKNIVFVSVSIDQAKDHNTWNKMVKEKELGGIQLIAENASESEFVKDYAIEGIPRFILIDPDGNIVSADAPRPSNPDLIKLFEELKI